MPYFWWSTNNGKKYWVNFSERFVCYSDNTLKEIIMVTGYSVNSLSHAYISRVRKVILDIISWQKYIEKNIEIQL